MTLFFCTLLFSGPYFGLDFLKVTGPKKISGRPDKLEKWVQIDWTTVRKDQTDGLFPWKLHLFWPNIEDGLNNKYANILQEKNVEI